MGQLAFSLIEDSLIRSTWIGHEKGIGLMTSEYVAMTSTFGSKDELTSAI
ncbi:hypothetical protein Pint_24418 [Pistacia integerrima]|uniref:Uncharacterized protein n=1 Tax=Pistacia integerrima TaxID=434235 RepID=A0ACC0YF84_9ROSI|nr:hypothetical protein Pint_24418 [Pistacia integerrima]